MLFALQHSQSFGKNTANRAPTHLESNIFASRNVSDHYLRLPYDVL